MATKRPTLKALLKGPLPYILVGVGVVVLGISLLTAGGFRPVSTQEGLELLQDNQVQKATIIDGEQRVDLELRQSFQGEGTQVQFYYVSPRGDEIVAAVNNSDVTEFTDEVPQTNWLCRSWASSFPSCSSASFSGSSSAACRAVVPE